MIQTIEKNILNATEEYICHQCNCVTREAAGLAAQLFQKWSYADCYSTRWEPDMPGTINIASERKSIINMFAQVYPGAPKDPNDKHDGFQARKKYFIYCLRAIALNVEPNSSLAFPYKIGCGMAGGDWAFYELAINKFATINKLRVTFYKKP